MRGKNNPIVRRVKIELKAGVLKPKEIAAKYGCSIGTVYDANYRMRKAEKEKKAEERNKRLSQIKEEISNMKEDPKPRTLSYKEHLEIELDNIKKERMALDGAAAYLTFRISQLNGTRQ